MFVIFEGIDGSGKTTISNRVGERLRAQGLTVAHVRERGTFTSTAAQAIRELGRDARNLKLAPTAELLLYAARDIQSLEEIVIPAIGTADVVLADRYLYSAQLLATAGRGLPEERVAAIIAPLTARLRPDLSILVDVPPDIARARRKVSKQLVRDLRSPSRKGLTGGGLQLRLRSAHLDLAHRHPDRWLVVENDDVELSEVIDAVTDAIATAARQGVAAGLDQGRRRLPRPGAPLPHDLATAADARAALLAWVDRRAVREPMLAAYMLAGLWGPDIDARRFALRDRAPVVLASGIGGLDDAATWKLRELLVEAAPDPIARSLGNLLGAEAQRWRLALAPRVPEAVASSLRELDDDEAWALREELRPLAADAVTASLARLASVRADAARQHWLDALPGAGPASYLAARAGARSVTGRADDLAWKIRKRVFALAPVDAIASTEGVDHPRAWKWRDEYAERAPRPVSDSLTGLTVAHAWELRRRMAHHCREVFASMVGLDSAEAWALREESADRWPSTVCKSLGPLSVTPRGKSLIAELLGKHPTVSLLRNAAKISPA